MRPFGKCPKSKSVQVYAQSGQYHTNVENMGSILITKDAKESMKDEKENFGEFFADKVLEVLAKDMGEFGYVA